MIIRRRHMKRRIVKLLVVGFAINIVFNYFLKLFYIEKDFEIHNIRPESASDSKSIVFIKGEVLHSKKTMIRSENPSTVSKCGYNSCPTGKPGFLNVHIVPHSHDDLGFVNTMDQYYYGEGKIIGVAKVIDDIVEGLTDHPYRKFIFVEVAFFHRWWNAQNETGRNKVKNLVENGQLEFVNGGWCMNDEAVTHYVDIIDQMSLGSNFLNETFGECGRPKIGWQIDSFGHSKEHANLLAQMGFDGMFLWRLPQEELLKRRKSKSMEFVWSGNSNLGVDGKLFTSILYNSYDPPEFLCLKKDHFNETWVDLFLDYLKIHTQSYRTTDIMVPIGTDFRLREDFTCFVPTDKLIEHVNRLQEKGSKVHLFYSTPSCYLKALNSHQNITWPVKMDDMFPYLTNENDPRDPEYWTGFFTSRPAFKYMVREGSNLLQSCKQMTSYLSMKSAEFVGDISVMKKAMGVMQHHDAITGTSKQFVIDDYARILHRGFKECLKIQSSFYQKELPKSISPQKTLLEVSYCSLNMSQCEVTEKSERVIVNVYNSLSSYVNKYVRVPVLNRPYRIFDPSGRAVSFDLIPIPEFVKTLPGRNSSATHELIFLAFQLPPLGSKSYYIQVQNKSNINAEVKNENKEWSIENQRVMVQLNQKTGLIQSVSVDGQKIELEQEILWYAAREPQYYDSGYLKNRGSGIYMFGTNQTSPFPLRHPQGIFFSIYKGKLVQEIHQHYNDWVGQVIRLYKDQDHIELDWVVGPVNVKDNVGKEVVSRITTKLSSKKEFYTDANGRQIPKRRVGVHGDSLNTDIGDPVGGNYYPINAHISIKDETVDKQLTLLVDRAQGGSSLKDGQLEFMLHRRLVQEVDDGLREVLNEKAFGVGLTVRGTHLLVLSSISESAKLTRSLSHQLYKQPQISFIPTSLSFREWARSYNMETRILGRSLPLNVNILTLDQRSDGSYLLRLEHIYDSGEDVELSKSVVVNLRQTLLNGFSITSAEEMVLGGNQFKKDSKRLVWNELNESQQSQLSHQMNTVVNIENVTLHPMEIRTFILKIETNP